MELAGPRLPNFFLLGAGRCGTTSLYILLRQHPEIFLSEPKEPSFFCRPFQVVRDPVSYVELFRNAGNATVVGDASHVHFSHPDAARTIRAFFPTARFLLILRNPADRAYALYCWMTAQGHEWHDKFEDALAAENRRAADPAFMNKASHYEGNFMYFRSGLFGKQLQRYLEHYPRNAFHVTTLDRLSAQPNETLAEIYEFLDVRPIATTGGLKTNESVGVRSAQLQWLARCTLGHLSERGVPGAGRALSKVSDWNRGSRPPPLRGSTRAALLERYADDLRLLRQLSGIDLSG